MSVNLVPEHALPKTLFLEEELSSRGRRIDSVTARTVRAELSDRSSPAFEAVATSTSSPIP
jgi:hypothetical protein